MTHAEKAAFIAAQTQMMIAERDVMIAENEDRVRGGWTPSNGPQQFHEHLKKWEDVLGYNALINFFNREDS
jgi:hypothetical protein